MATKDLGPVLTAPYPVPGGTAQLYERGIILSHAGSEFVYAPDLNPVEALWSSVKAVELANFTGPTPGEVIVRAHRGIQRNRTTPHLASSFLRHTGLSVA